MSVLLLPFGESRLMEKAQRHLTCFIACAMVLLALGQSSFGRNVDLSTVPDRQTVQLTIYNSEDLTLVRETRKVTFRKGNNPLQFSWANTLIDPSSVELTFKTGRDRLSLVDTTYPHDKPQMLYWSVRSDFDGEALIQITYFTSGISWSADYVCVADAAEKQMSFESFSHHIDRKRLLDYLSHSDLRAA